MTDGKTVTVVIDGREIKAKEGKYVLEVARENSIHIPTLCYHESLTPSGACRLCVVEARTKNSSRIVASCLYPISDGLEISTNSDRVLAVRKLVVELLYARCPDVPFVKNLADKFGIKEPRFPKENDDCILCGLCVRACDEIVGVKAISMVGRGAKKEVNTPFGNASDVCIGCATCAYICPTKRIKVEEKDGYRKIWYKKFELVNCKKCGFPIGPKEQLTYFIRTARLPENFYDLCPSCR